tara:strand:- start:776 stop:4414 length:3639 start_codon:yes stop_codon:yes gene_type:complete
MLKALELIGFKSFADSTRFEFPPGITVVVGPNGSGKSNVVDAIKWVLGEQSAKSLRGKEMADVIFKSSGSSIRRHVNTAEASIIFDNSDGILPVEAEEVVVTRRVYRSGEGEYLINRQPCRLKDIRDLFRGTGVGADAYSLIEQGKVDELLMASPRARRAIFEEAAGISRFKAKKAEAERRLERVDQNLVRLSDIVDEVEGRLRSVRNQAGKARRYREYNDRLQQLRTQVGWTDWHRHSEQLAGIEQQIAQLVKEKQGLQLQQKEDEERLQVLESAFQAASDAILQTEIDGSATREQIASFESTISQKRERLLEVEQQVRQLETQRAILGSRAVDVQGQLTETVADLEKWEVEARQISDRLAGHREIAEDLDQQGVQFQLETDQCREKLLEKTGQAAALYSQLGALTGEEEPTRLRIRTIREELIQIADKLRDGHEQLNELVSEEQMLSGKLEQQADVLDAAEVEVAETRRSLSRRQKELADHQSRLSGVTERLDLLRQLEENHDGVAVGVQHVMEQVEQDPHGIYREYCGLVADLIEAPLESATLIDVVLGSRSQLVVMRGSLLATAIEKQEVKIAGRIGIMQMDSMYNWMPAVDLAGEAGIVERADRVVNVRPGYEKLAEHLLDSTWIVESLSDARRLAGRLRGKIQLVTLAGELVAADGTIHSGTMETAGGLISRRSELRALQQEKIILQQQVEQAEGDLEQTETEIQEQDQQIHRINDCRRSWNSDLVDLRVQEQSHKQLLVQLEKQQQEEQSSLRDLLGRQQANDRQRTRIDQQHGQLQTDCRELEENINSVLLTIKKIEQNRDEENEKVLTVKVQLATNDQQIATLRVRQAQFQQDHDERQATLEEVDQQLNQLANRIRTDTGEILQTSSRLADLYLEKERLQQSGINLTLERDQATGEKERLASEVHQARQQLQQLEQRTHKKELAAGECRLQREALEQRMRDDYDIEIAEADLEKEQETEEREQVDEEIASLRKKIGNIGAVNMEALEELEELDARFEALSSQFEDLTQAKDSLQRIISRINMDSRRLFTETLDAIRANFKVLYRKAFGGGEADIVLEEGADVLEGGVEIVTKPPGKPEIHISLLSGGERALTAVTLLLAIFQFRPSPFCVLDEVDAPFDEANIARFVNVLKEFLEWTRFVVVTHSKKTMTAADTLYGITMQESGVSKQVSVRFEDVTNDGNIRKKTNTSDPVQGSDDQQRRVA